jgi:hypothetical protein
LNIPKYVESIKTTLLVTTTDELIKIRDRYSQKVPESLNRQSPERKSKAEATQYQIQRKEKVVELNPPSKPQ